MFLCQYQKRNLMSFAWIKHLPLTKHEMEYSLSLWSVQQGLLPEAGDMGKLSGLPHLLHTL